MTGKNSAEVYARHVLAAPLREFEQVLHRIRNGSLRPDATRSGMIGSQSCHDLKEPYIGLSMPEGHANAESSSSSSDSSSDEEVPHADLALPLAPVAEPKVWDPDFDMFQHRKRIRPPESRRILPAELQLWSKINQRLHSGERGQLLDFQEMQEMRHSQTRQRCRGVGLRAQKAALGT